MSIALPRVQSLPRVRLSNLTSPVCSRYGKRSSQHLSRGALRREAVLDTLANAEQAMEAESVDAVPDYLFQ